MRGLPLDPCKAQLIGVPDLSVDHHRDRSTDCHRLTLGVGDGLDRRSGLRREKEARIAGVDAKTIRLCHHGQRKIGHRTTSRGRIHAYPITLRLQQRGRRLGLHQHPLDRVLGIIGLPQPA
ncbi:MAG: hypothetical protein BWZ07_02507 [Alphaproteobacteria bacterium ADurb.BinA280]|nr:MAG: hypothetical protein BWZ07_02507 [Alphaproteobacteria bacterium ADurb.BinA280]